MIRLESGGMKGYLPEKPGFEVLSHRNYVKNFHYFALFMI